MSNVTLSSYKHTPFIALRYTQNQKYGKNRQAHTHTQAHSYTHTHTHTHTHTIVKNIEVAWLRSSPCYETPGDLISGVCLVPQAYRQSLLVQYFCKIPVQYSLPSCFQELVGSAACTLQILCSSLQVFLHTGVSAMYIEIKPQSVNANPTHTYVRRTVLFLDKNHREVSSKFFTKLEMFSKIKNFPLKRG